MISKILVPLDGSKRAEAILPYVQELARRFDAHVIFLRVVEPVPVPVSVTSGIAPSVELMQEAVDRQAREIDNYLSALKGEFRELQIKTDTEIVYGSTVNEIVDAASREGVDLIAIGSHGRTGLSQVFYGSVATGVLHKAMCPVLVIRADEDMD
jgi:nucleotide-binding universal stress UspA family protein